MDSSRTPVTISKSGTISVKDGTTTKSYNTDTQAYSKSLTSNAIIKVTSSSTSTASTLSTNTATAAILNDNSGNITSAESATTTSNTDNDDLTRRGSSNTNTLEQQSAERQANLAQQKALKQLDKNMKTDGNLPTQLTNKSTETQNQNHGQGIKPEKSESMDPKISGKHDTRNERSDNVQSENSRKNSDHTSRLPPSGNDGQSPNHETLLTLMVTMGNGNGNYILAGKTHGFDNRKTTPRHESIFYS